jgi:hypothetical protein
LDFSGTEVRLMDHDRCSIVDNRSALVQALLEMEPSPTYLLFIDTEASVPRDGLQKLLEEVPSLLAAVIGTTEKETMRRQNRGGCRRNEESDRATRP